MEENKYLCPNCGEEMTATYEKPALNLLCPKCGCEIATTRWDNIDLDDNDYEITLKATDNPKIESIKLIARMVGINFISAKELIKNGGLLLKAKAIDIKTCQETLKKGNIEFEIRPLFPY